MVLGARRRGPASPALGGAGRRLAAPRARAPFPGGLRHG